MNYNVKASALVEKFSPQIGNFNTKTKIWLGGLLFVMIIGLFAFIMQMVKGQEVTGMRDNVVWGVYDINFILVVGFSYSGAFISGILHFYNTPWKNGISRIIEIITVFSMVIGPIYIILCMGRLDRLHYLFLYPRIQSPITWDIIAVMTDLFACFLYLYLTFIPDMAILRDNAEKLNVPNWQKKAYKFFAIGYNDTPSQRKRLHKVIRMMSTIIILLAIVAYSVLAWIFSLTLQPGWNSTIFAPYFIVGGLYSGIAMILITMYFARKYLNLDDYIHFNHFKLGGFLLMILALVFGYFTFTDYFAKWYSTKVEGSMLLDSLFTRYFWYFIVANYIGIIVPIFVFFFKKFRTIKGITIASFIAIFGVWLNRYLIIIPTLENPYLPIQDIRPEFVHYSATWVEYALSFTGIAAFLFFFTLIVKFVPVIPMSGIIEHEEKKIERKLIKSRKSI